MALKREQISTDDRRMLGIMYARVVDLWIRADPEFQPNDHMMEELRMLQEDMTAPRAPKSGLGRLFRDRGEQTPPDRAPEVIHALGIIAAVQARYEQPESTRVPAKDDHPAGVYRSSSDEEIPGFSQELPPAEDIFAEDSADFAEEVS